MDPKAKETLALYGGPKAVDHLHTHPQPKVGVAEFLSIAERFGFSADALARIRAAISDADLGPGPNLARYATAYPPETKGEAFEALAREVFGVRYALGVSSGTAALHSAYVAVGVGPGTEVICPAVGFFATAAAVVEARGVPVFCDVDTSMHMDPQKIEALITPRTVAIAPTHVAGGVCDMDPIMEIARRHGLKVIEDCAQSPGAKYKGRYVGTIGDIGCYSISCYKIIGGGEAGLVVTNDERLWARAVGLTECGGLWRPNRFAPPRYPGELFCGTNYRMSELEAAVDVVQLGKLASIVGRYNSAKRRILQQLRTYREITPQKLNDPDGEVGYTLRFYPESLELGEELVRALNAEGISCGMRGADGGPDWHVYHDMFAIMQQTGQTPEGCPWQCPIYHERGGQIAYTRGDCPVADDLFDRSVVIGIDQWLTPQDCDAIASGLNKVFSAYCTEDPNAARWL